MSRKWHSALLLAVVVSQLVLGVHAAAHSPAAQAGCEICSAYGNPIDSLPGGESSPPAVAWTSVCAVWPVQAVTSSRGHPAHPRAPPDQA